MRHKSEVLWCTLLEQKSFEWLICKEFEQCDDENGQGVLTGGVLGGRLWIYETKMVGDFTAGVSDCESLNKYQSKDTQTI